MNNKQRGWPEGCGGLYWEEMGMMDEIGRALLGDKEAQDALTERRELLPCPFCGSEARLFVQNGVRVICPKCDASSKILVDGRGPRGVSGNATQAVVRAWNRRAPILGADGMEAMNRETD